MHPPDAEKKNGPGGSSRSRQGQSNQKAAEDAPTVPRQRGPRHVPGQSSLPIVPALAYPPAPGLKLALLVVEECPACGWWHRHSVAWPAAKLLSKRGKCGQAYQLIPYARRKRRRAA
jgi:hypothetical protein